MSEAVALALAAYVGAVVAACAAHDYYWSFSPSPGKRLLTALRALRGERLQRWHAITDPGGFSTIRVEHPMSMPENPSAALFGHVSPPEQRYLALSWLLDTTPDGAFDAYDDECPFGCPPYHHRLMAHKRDLRAEAERAIAGRAEPDRSGDLIKVVDPQTGYVEHRRLPVLVDSDEAEELLSLQLERFPGRALEHEEQVLDTDK